MMKTNEKVIVLGSSRSDGNTRKAIDKIIEGQSIPVVDLLTYDISQFDYQHKNQKDDFIPLIESLLEFELIVFATPVYW